MASEEGENLRLQGQGSAQVPTSPGCQSDVVGTQPEVSRPEPASPFVAAEPSAVTSASVDEDGMEEVATEQAPSRSPTPLLDPRAWQTESLRTRLPNCFQLTDDHHAAIADFFAVGEEQLLCVYQLGTQTVVERQIPSGPASGLHFFLRVRGPPITQNDVFNDRVQWGSVASDQHMDSLQNLVNKVFVPLATADPTWSTSIRHEFATSVNRFLSAANDHLAAQTGTTLLFLPNEDLSLADERVTEEQVQRLEAVVIHWTRQIKTLVTATSQQSLPPSALMADEYAFWKRRSDNLTRVGHQLDHSVVKTIHQVLRGTKSTYLAQFDSWAGSIKASITEAQTILKFLSSLTQPFAELDQATLPAMAAILPDMVDTIRFIWLYCPAYGSRDRVAGLFRSITNAVLKRCCSQIHLDDFFFGDVAQFAATLRLSIAACQTWKTVYAERKEVSEYLSATGTTSHEPWSLNHSSIFAPVDAFIQRCLDLLDLAEGQTQFGRRHGLTTSPIPIIRGSQGENVVKALLQIETKFAQSMDALRALGDSILDVQSQQWHTQHTALKASIHGLEVMLQNVVTAAFDAVQVIPAGLELLLAFKRFESRDLVKRALDKGKVRLFTIFVAELDAVKKLFSAKRQAPRLPVNWPSTAGAAYWALSLVRSVEKSKRLLDTVEVSEEVVNLRDTQQQFAGLVSGLKEYANKAHAIWVNSQVSDLDKLLMIPLLKRSADGSMLELNFDQSLLRLYQEVEYWSILGYDIPLAAKTAFNKKEEMRTLREHILLALRDYNAIIATLNSDERNLFRARIRYLDKKMQPGFVTLYWGSKGISEYFVADSRAHAKTLKTVVDKYKRSNAKLVRLCELMASINLFTINEKHIYVGSEFEAEQARHQEASKEELLKCHGAILRIMRETYEVFQKDGDVQQYWHEYTTRIDAKVLSSLRICLKRSLQTLSRAINGDGKSIPCPLFRLNVVLQDNMRVEFEPPFRERQKALINLANEVGLAFEELHRLPAMLAKGTGAQIPYHATLMDDSELTSLLSDIQHGVVANAPNLHAYLTTWRENYHEIWEIDKVRFVQAYAETRPSLSRFDADIGRYGEVANNVQREDSLMAINFILIDCSPLKYAVVEHCNTWKDMLAAVLCEQFKRDTSSLQQYLEATTAQLALQPTKLDEMVASLSLLEQTKLSMVDTEQRFAPVREQCVILQKYTVNIPQAVLAVLEGLPDQWQAFTEELQASEKQLDKAKSHFRQGLLQDTENLSRQVVNLRTDFLATVPTGGAVDPAEAQQQLQKFRQQLAEVSAKESALKAGLRVFEIVQAPYKEVQDMERDIALLEQLWALAAEWQELYQGWASCGFRDIDTDKMELEAQVRLKQLLKIDREAKDKDWPVLQAYRERINQFKRTMPLVQDLKNEALRPRHWQQLMDQVGRTFDPHSVNFTLGAMVDLGLDQWEEFVSAVSTAASKEQSIEQSIATIAAVWNSMQLEIVPYKDRAHYILRGTDEIFQLLEDNQVTMGTMKASRYVKAFEREVDAWECTLNLILEVIEMILTVQRQWMYLENIFLGEDIRKQLPVESHSFDRVNEQWKERMTKLHTEPNAQRGAQTDGLLSSLAHMNTELEKIQKSLDMYLETKRQLFPRFYFVSNDDLLEILGQSKTPEAIQSHLLKCFDNIKALEISPPTAVRRHPEAAGMHSDDGEYVPFRSPVLLDGPVEGWLLLIEAEMRHTLRHLLVECKSAIKKQRRDKWIKDWAGQLVLTISQMTWTSDCVKSMTSKEGGARKGLKGMKKKQVSLLNKLTEAVRSVKSKVQRKKLVALITVEVHSRDVIDRLMKVSNIDQNAFEWLMQLRFYWEKEQGINGDCVVRQTNTRFTYGYEYLGNSGRLVITPLTDRCYMTLTTALHLHRGGSPKGPAGTGKTETVKDLGKALGDYVIVVNCSEGLDYKSLGRMFSGLAQTGAWGCFDEFNRINIEVLSVVAQQILSILSAQTVLDPDNTERRFVFEGADILLRWSCGIFITMNPGYAGRTELPDNLKSMFRPISMMVPDSGMIAEIILFGQGFANTRALAKKVHTMYKLAVQQLSKQDHYDFGLRALVSVLLNAGRKRQVMVELPEEEIAVLAMKDMNVAKMTAADLPLFLAIMSDLFPGVETQAVDYGVLKVALEEDLKEHNYQVKEFTVTKALQLYETKTSRHSVMIVGQTGSGKSVAWQTLQRALTRCCKAGHQGYVSVKAHPINPKALSLAELYGEFDIATNEWADGVLSSVMRQTCADEKLDQKWIIFDAPVDTLWIESMNSVMDDNKILTLINGERISMPDQVSLLFEVEDLAVASPATVSRCGMVFHDTNDLGWRPYVDSWLDHFPNRSLVPALKSFFEKYVEGLLEFVRLQCTELVPTTVLNRVVSLCNLLETFLPAEGEAEQLLPLWFSFCCAWSVCATVNEAGRKRVDSFLRELGITQYPAKDTVFEYTVDPKASTWVHWEEHLRPNWRFSPQTPFYKIQVPTVDTLRYDFLVYNLLLKNKPVLLVGPVGTGKTSLVEGVMARLDPEKFSLLTVNMSSKTSSNNLQQILESQIEKRTKGVYVPLGGKQLLTFLDDLNMPAKDTFGSQPPLELYRQWMDYGFWYDRQKQTIKYVRDMRSVAAMGPPGGGRSVISQRLQARFNLINMTFPTDTTVRHIFGTMITQKLQEFDESVKALATPLTAATIDVYNTVSTKMLPTPAKIHYLFNLRDISKVFQGLFRASKFFHDSKEALLRLWVHECNRVFCDRLVGDKDVGEFAALVEERLDKGFEVSYSTLCPEREAPIFGDFCSVDSAQPVYEDLIDQTQLKKVMEEKLEDYNSTPGMIPMNLVLFRDAIQHVSRVARVVREPRGNMLLIGVGGSGRQSLCRLAAYLLEYKVFQIEVTRHYRMAEFREDLKNLYRQTGIVNTPTVFLFNDTQIVVEDFVEDINNILSSGEVPNLFAADEMEAIRAELVPAAKKAGVEETPPELYRFFIERVRNNLHVVLCMSPVGEAFRNRMRMYPGLVNCTTIDFFSAWPQDALLAVAARFLEDVSFVVEGPEVDDSSETPPLTGASLQLAIATMFTHIHQSVVSSSQQMLAEIHRHNYVTPINYLELVYGYKKLLAEKRQEVGDAALKLTNGLEKIDDTRTKVQKMSIELEETRHQVAQFQQECEEYLVVIVQQKREADDQQKAVSARGEKIAVEAAACQEMAEAAQADLDEALPALEAAVEALNSLNKNDITEIKSYSKPPPLVETVLQAVMILRRAKPDWTEAKRHLNDGNFIKQLIEFDKDNIPQAVLQKISKYVARPDFTAEVVGRVSNAARSLCLWVRAMDVYGRIFRVVEPKKMALKAAQETLSIKESALQEAKNKLHEVTERVAQLQHDYEAKLKTKEELREKSELTAIRLDRAGKLVTGLAGERVRWEQTVKALHLGMGFLPGDCLMAAAFISYLGPFTVEYRMHLVTAVWLPAVQAAGIPHTPNFSMITFMAKPTDVRFWNIQGLPTDAFSTENGVIVTRGERWPLMIDPQGQAIKWIKNMERERNLKIVDLQQPDFLRTLENAIQFGTPVLMQNVGEELDPSLEPILTKAFVKRGGRLILKLGDKEIEYNPDFRFYITTKMANPHYGPEISTKTTIVNFAVVEQGLEAQLLGIVVRRERPELEEQKDQLVLNIAAGKKRLVELEDRILQLLATAQGSLLDNEALVETLNSSKVTSAEVMEQLEISETTEAEIDAAREGYRPCSKRAAVLFFALNDIEKIDPMYQFALDAYVHLFNSSITNSMKSNNLIQRIENVNAYHTYSVYRYTCRGLFEEHKLLFSFHMNAKIMESARKLNLDEYNFFLRGGQVLDRELQIPNPAPDWIQATAWDDITEMSRLLPKFQGLGNSFEQLLRDWKLWYTSGTPELAVLPGEWENSCNELQRMLILRCLRPDRVALVATSFIINNLGPRFVEPPALDMADVLADSSPNTPLIFVLSSGVDPAKMLLDFAEKKAMQERVFSLSLGQGQAPIAERMIADGAADGHWVFLANCHLSLSWMPQLSKLVELLEVNKPHPDFRLWLSSTPTPNFPISILQAGIKMTTEPPMGMRANIKRLYATLSQEQFEGCQHETKFKRLVFGLSFFHSVLLERRKFQNLGWNVVYGFNDSDYQVSVNLLSIYLDEYTDTPWDALKYLIAGVNYGGHVTDDWDRRLLQTYINDVFCEDSLTKEQFAVCPAEQYHIPPEGNLQSYLDYIDRLPSVDPPEAFGQHSNADISSMIRGAQTLLGTLVSLQPTKSLAGGITSEEKVLELVADMLSRLPKCIDEETTAKMLHDDPNPLNVVLLQELARYNALLRKIYTSLRDLQNGIRGLVVMSTDLETTFTCIYNGHLPPMWAGTFPSKKPLAAWTRDLIERVEMFAQWAQTGRQPLVFWMSAFTFPSGFLTAVLQNAARNNSVSIDTLAWEYNVLTVDDVNIVEAPVDGVYVKGLYLEGAGWDRKSASLTEANAMELVCPMPTIHFKPVENKKTGRKGYYQCPCYYYSNRAGEGGAAAWSFVIAVDLKAGVVASTEHWIKRGTALLMSLDN